MPQTGEKRQANIEIKAAAPVEGNYGPQWQMEVVVPWSKYPFKGWIDRADGEAPPNGAYSALLECGKLKQNKNGSADWDWNWKVLDLFANEAEEPQDAEVDVPATQPDPQMREFPKKEAPAPVAPAPTYESQEAVRNASIQRQTALKAAVDFYTNDEKATSAMVVVAAEYFSRFLSGETKVVALDVSIPVSDDNEPPPSGEPGVEDNEQDDPPPEHEDVIIDNPPAQWPIPEGIMSQSKLTIWYEQHKKTGRDVTRALGMSAVKYKDAHKYSDYRQVAVDLAGIWENEA